MRRNAKALAIVFIYVSSSAEAFALANGQKYENPSSNLVTNQATKAEDQNYTHENVRQTRRKHIAAVEFVEEGTLSLHFLDQSLSPSRYAIPQMLLAEFDPKVYEEVDRLKLEAIMKQKGISIEMVRDNPEVIYGKLGEVEYLIFGKSINDKGQRTISARLVNESNGDVIQTAEVKTKDERDLQEALVELAKQLQMTSEEKKAYISRPRSSGKMSALAPAIIRFQGEPPKTISIALGGGVEIKCSLIPAGSFMMGSSAGGADEVPQHEVVISRPYYVGMYEVTQEQYQTVMGKNPSKIKGQKNPVDSVTWPDAVAFCRKLSAKTGWAVRLPTEAEWEYACRAGSAGRYCFGDNEKELVSYAWYGNNSGMMTHPVGQKQPNAWGLYDMNGNVWEWCDDWYSPSYYKESTKVDPQGPNAGTADVLRGGSWGNDSYDCRSANRLMLDPVSRSNKFGFRVVVEMPK